MPEGDSIYRAAKTLDRAFAGHLVVGFETRLAQLHQIDDDRRLEGRTIERVSSEGKHILMHFSGDLILHTHMRMNGSWHIYRRGERWRKARADMRVVIATAELEAVGFNLPVAEFLSTRELTRHEELRRLGPDLLSEAFEAAEALRRFRARDELEIAEAVLNQRIVAGIGNVYKSEVLFLERIRPSRPVQLIDDPSLLKLLERARSLLGSNITDGSAASIVTYHGPRRTTRRSDPADRLWVYGRSGRPCRVCGRPIESCKQGADARLTFWCETCQR